MRDLAGKIERLTELYDKSEGVMTRETLAKAILAIPEIAEALAATALKDTDEALSPTSQSDRAA